MILQHWQHVLSDIPQERIVHHRELDIGGTGGLQEQEVLCHAQLLEAGDYCWLHSDAAFCGHSVLSSETVIDGSLY